MQEFYKIDTENIRKAMKLHETNQYNSCDNSSRDLSLDAEIMDELDRVSIKSSFNYNISSFQAATNNKIVSTASTRLLRAKKRRNKQPFIHKSTLLAPITASNSEIRYFKILKNSSYFIS